MKIGYGEYCSRLFRLNADITSASISYSEYRRRLFELTKSAQGGK